MYVLAIFYISTKILKKNKKGNLIIIETNIYNLREIYKKKLKREKYFFVGKLFSNIQMKQNMLE